MSGSEGYAAKCAKHKSTTTCIHSLFRHFLHIFNESLCKHFQTKILNFFVNTVYRDSLNNHIKCSKTFYLETDRLYWLIDTSSGLTDWDFYRSHQLVRFLVRSFSSLNFNFETINSRQSFFFAQNGKHNSNHQTYQIRARSEIISFHQNFLIFLFSVKTC